MRSCKVPETVIKVIQNVYVKSESRTKRRRVFRKFLGVRQVHALSPMLINLVIEEALRKTSNSQWAAKFGENANVLAYVDDVPFIAERGKILENWQKNS